MTEDELFEILAANSDVVITLEEIDLDELDNSEEGRKRQVRIKLTENIFEDD